MMGTKTGGIVLAALLLSGCSAVQTPTPNDQQLAIDSAGDAGAIACAVIRMEADPEDVIKARLSAQAALAVLSEPAPSVEALSAALREGLPENYAALTAVIIQRIKVRLDGADLLPHGTLAWKMGESFVSACELALS